MLQVNSRAERPAGVQALQSPKAVSPLQQEINLLKESLEGQRKIIDELRIRLATVFQEVPANEKQGVGEYLALSEMPTQVRDCKLRAESNTSTLAWLIDHLEV